MAVHRVAIASKVVATVASRVAMVVSRAVMAVHSRVAMVVAHSRVTVLHVVVR